MPHSHIRIKPKYGNGESGSLCRKIWDMHTFGIYANNAAKIAARDHIKPACLGSGSRCSHTPPFYTPPFLPETSNNWDQKSEWWKLAAKCGRLLQQTTLNKTNRWLEGVMVWCCNKIYVAWVLINIFSTATTTAGKLLASTLTTQ